MVTKRKTGPGKKAAGALSTPVRPPARTPGGDARPTSRRRMLAKAPR